MALGYKVKNNFCTKMKCIKVFVTHKVPLNKLLNKDIIPPTYKGIPTDIVKRSLQKPYSFNQRIRPVPGGFNIGPSKSSASGTLGCLVTDKENVYILSNSHILSEEGCLPLGTGTLQPCYVLGGKPVKDQIATLYKFVPLQPIKSKHEPTNFMDCAISKVCDRTLVTSKLALLGNIKGITSPHLGQLVQKVGSSSEFTKGKVTELGATIVVSLTHGNFLFKDQIITTNLASPGDSGALLCDMHMNAVGLIMSGDENETTSNPIKKILSSLNVKIIG